LKKLFREKVSQVGILNSLVKYKELKHVNYFVQFATEVLMETLEFCELKRSDMMELISFVMENSNNKVFDQLVQLILKNKQELNTQTLSLLSFNEMLSDSHILSILEKLEGMKEGILKIEVEYLIDILNLSISPKISAKSVPILKRFHFIILID
jgi:glycyl-tRNA synthetase alpha subunit